MRANHRGLWSFAGTAGVVVLTLASGARSAAAEEGSISATATASATRTQSYTATVSRDVTATASWGNPAIERTATDTLAATDTEQATRTATVTQTASGPTEADAQAAAQQQAADLAGMQADIEALIAASIAANTAASQQVADRVEQRRTALYNQALAEAKAAVLDRDGPPTGGVVSACGDPLYKSDETPWTCTFDDEFDGTALDPAKWTSWNGVNYFSAEDSGDDVCFYDDPAHVSVADGSLRLGVTRVPDGTTCLTPAGVTHPTYGAGVVHTSGKFDQTYGLFQARIKFAGGAGIHDDFWLYPADTSSGDHAEIDVAEPRGSLPNTMYSATHMTQPGAPASDELGETSWCDVDDWADGYHTYAVQWSPGELVFSYDDTVCSIRSNWPQLDGEAAHGPFDRDFFVILEALADSGSEGPTPNTVLPSGMQVDWVRAWS